MEKFWFRECVPGRRFIIKLWPGIKIAAALVEFARAKNLAFASVISAVGSVRDVEFTSIRPGANLPVLNGQLNTNRVEGPLELLGLEGNIAPTSGKVLEGQFYILGSGATGEVVGGHLVDAEVFAPCELVLAEYLVEGVERYRSATTGVDTLFIEDW
jgi:hypothetical protein